MALTRWICTNCGFWQRFFARPSSCPVCLDHRHVPPEERWEFLSADEADARTETLWAELEPGVWRFTSSDPLGIGPAGYLVEHPGGNVFWDGAPWLSDAALAHLEARGGVAWLAGSHPHAYGALWRVAEAFSPEVALHRGDLPWATAFDVTWPFDDDGLALHDDVRIHHTGGHFAGHAVLHLASARILLCGDALKFLLDPEDERRATRISTHQAFVRQVPLTRDEMRRYRKVFAPLDFEQTWTPFEQAANAGRTEALALLDGLLADRPSAEWREL